ncbi:peptidase family m20 m25 m40 protein [Grosmannia clavigera kw1407]|uniref:Peptidase family m20 m25 m40 protein n=1 Tax=Grosmannia clavigera (strain kw1407 / UAMH 11150) TaxID=655863 RepID=F0XUN5_GROCL|nr:peptidase family m20 m25 m40 protein [Grosmannia clavigera kw1407]EFW98515.1 peptidase family m20 m25 m40 protein [Grosmannia clavigera kw1407]
MAEVAPESTPAPETLHKDSSKTRRLRPPGIDDTAAGNDNRIPLRADKLDRRESRLGLRGLFSRNKSSSQNVRASVADLSNWPYSPSTTRSEISLPPDREQQVETGPAAKIKTPRTPTTPASQARRPIQPRTKLPTAPPPVAASSTPKPRKTSTQGPSPPSRSARGSLATWDPPPLFQAYPQAIKHARLPACTTSIEVLTRLQSNHGGGTSSSANSVRESSLADAAGDIAAADRGIDKTKRRHRRNTSASSTKLDWSSKIYVFVTSGYLLQYAGEGSFDRLPEKMLHIGKDSAAFASDLIPGRHWVLQICSDTEASVPLTPDSRSLFSRLPFRSERRHASALLMVFESAEDMENWLSTLRREIEHLGGKKHLSETGNPKANDRVLQLKGQPSQRALVVRDPERFSRAISPQDMASSPWRLDSALGTDSPTPDIHLEAPIVFKASRETDPSADDMSVTNSLVSQDGRQLESLRESANRLSFISSGQRTVVTSECSSPPCSPICDSFTSSNADEPSSALADSPKEAWPHPNTAVTFKYGLPIQTSAKSDRLSDFRFPMPAGHPKPPTHLAQPAPPPLRSHTVVFCNGNMPMPHSQSVLSPVQTPKSPGFCVSPTMPLPAIPNFSVPHKSSTRSSVALKSPSLGQTQSIVPLGAPTSAPPQTKLPAPPQKLPLSRSSTRRLPPPSLAFSRPLSVVPDQPSPPSKSPVLSRIVTQAALETDSDRPGCSDVQDTSSLPSSFELSADTEQGPSTQTSVDVSRMKNPRGRVDVLAASPVEALLERARVKTSALPTRGTMPATASTYSPANSHKESFRPSSAMDLHRRSSNRSLIVGSDAKRMHHKRASMFAQAGEVLPRPTESMSTKLSLPERPIDAADSRAAATRGRFLERREQHVPRSSASNVHLRAHSTPQKALSYRRRSMSQLAEGPPPAPPPTRALPPLPPNFGSVRGRRGA